MNLKDDSDFLSAFSTTDTPVISDGVAEFLENSTHMIKPKEELVLKIKSSCIDEKEKDLYPKAIKKYYTERYQTTERELKANNIIALFLVILGVMVLAFAVFLNYRVGSVIWSEVVDIAAWVFLWEAVDIKFFKTRELSVKKKRYLSFIFMDIEFVNY